VPGLKVNPDRLRADFKALSAIGATGDGGTDMVGVHRPSLDEAHLAAREWFRARIDAAGLAFCKDGAGNHSALLACGPSDARTLLLGSHLDSVPYGGRFDGPLGVLAALEVLRVVIEADLSLPFHLEAVDFTDEEGTLVGLLGSRALAGHLSRDELANPRGGRQRLLEGLSRAGLTEDGLLGARRDPDTLAGYLELHIEQGPRLFNSGLQIGVVTAIVGIAAHRLVFQGAANHAGTTPMDARRDAGLGASAFAVAARQVVLESYPGCVMNVGAMDFEPGAYNIVPGKVTVTLEMRAPKADTLKRMEAELLACARQQAGRYDLELTIEALGRHNPAPMHPHMMDAIRSAADTLGLSHTDLHSGAGHDAQSLAAVCPSGMLFIPSVDGVSHSPREFSRWEDCLNGANILLQAVLTLAGTKRVTDNVLA